MTTILRVEQLSKVYGSGDAAIRVLHEVSLAVDRGQRLACLGRSGSGKSTLLHLLAGLDTATSGTIRVEGVSLHTLTAPQRADYRLATVGIVFQAFHLIAARTAWENVELPLIFAGVDRRERRQRAEAALDRVGLHHRRSHRPMELSGGERQRVAIARALIHRPRLLLADEPTGNLDTTTASGVMHMLLEQVRAEGTTLILVTHDEELAGRVADRVVRMQDGCLVESTS